MQIDSKSSTTSLESGNDHNYIVPNLDRACSVLEYLSEQGMPCCLSDIARVLDMPKNSVFRILYTLERRDFVRQIDRNYMLSGKLLAIGHSIVDGSTLLEKALPHLRELRDETRETVGFAVLNHEHEGIVLEQIPGPEPIKIQISVGYRFPLHTAAPGKAMIAFLPEEEREQVMSSLMYRKYTENTILTADAFRSELEKIRIRGYALDREEQIEHINCVGAPIFDHRMKVVAAAWITGPIFRMTSGILERNAPTVVATCRKISQELGCNV